ncbi:hypothetical protein ZWY2020_007071 [Hordeum vulgare]|nr:hypothetical protein ZWY2020_007071 [Hordeum vulgare]
MICTSGSRTAAGSARTSLVTLSVLEARRVGSGCGVVILDERYIHHLARCVGSVVRCTSRIAQRMTEEDLENDTSAEAKTSTGHVVRVTFILADPPAVSYFCIHGSGLKHENYFLEPQLVFSEKHLVLLRFTFTIGPRSTVHDGHLSEYFVYRATPAPGKPSLRPIPTATLAPDKGKSYPTILPFPDDADDNFVVADLAPTPTLGGYVLHTFSSKTNKWIAKPLQLHVSPAVMDDLPELPHKVIALGADTIGWIDLWRGIIVCNVFDPDPVLRFILLPKPGFNLLREGDPGPYRDVAFRDGFIKFVEMEHFERRASPDSSHSKEMNFKTTADLDDQDVINNSELYLKTYSDLIEDEPCYVHDGFQIRTCYRHASWDHWRKGHSVHVDDILVNNPRHHMMLPYLWDASARKFTLRNLAPTICPTFSIHGEEDVVYLIWTVG